MIELLKDIFIVLAYMVGILAATFFVLLWLIVIVKTWKGRR